MLRTTVVMWREVDVVSAAPHIGAEPALAPPGSANGTAPPGKATASSQSRSPAAIGLVKGATSSNTSKACSAATGWLAGARRSGSSAHPKPPSALRYPRLSGAVGTYGLLVSAGDPGRSPSGH
jgi:hypothetical protein